MSAFTKTQFGETASLLRAIGLINAQEKFDSDWFHKPDVYLKKILADDGQRDALLNFVSNVRGEDSERDASDRHWIEVFSENLDTIGAIRFYIVMDDRPADEVRLYFGVKLDAGIPKTICRSTILFPLFRTSKDSDNPNPQKLIEETGGEIELSVDLILSGDDPASGEAGIGGLGLTISIPTIANTAAMVGLTFTDLQLPGETTPRDLTLSLTDPNTLKTAGIDLVLALLQAQIGTTSSSQIQALGELLGLGESPNIPNFPLSELTSEGISAISEWLAQTLGPEISRNAWLSALKDLIGSGATSTTEGVSIPVGTNGNTIDIGLKAQPGSSGQPIIILSLGFGFSAANGTRAAFKAKLVELDLSTGHSKALTDLRTELVLDVGIDTTNIANSPDIKVDTLAFGLALDTNHKPIVVLEMHNVEIDTTTYDVLDLTDADAVAVAASLVAEDVLQEVLDKFGPAGDLLAVVLGFEAPNGASSNYPLIDIMDFLGNPLASLHTHWQKVFDNHTSDVKFVLSVLNELITGNPGAVIGDGTDTAPWLIPLDTTNQFALALWRSDTGKLIIGLSLRFKVDDLGQRCTVIESRLRVAIASIDLANGHCEFLTEVVISALGRARGGGRLELKAANLRLEVDYLGLTARWTPADSLAMSVEAPNLLLFLDEISLPLDFPDFSGDFKTFFGSLNAPQWRSLERITALLAMQLDFGWLQDLIGAFHWMPEPAVLGNPSSFRLSLKGLYFNPGFEIKGWFLRLIRGKGEGIDRVLKPMGRLLSGNPLDTLHVEGAGTIADPFRIQLGSNPARPALALWLEPDIIIPHPEFLESNLLRSWRPGMGGLSAASLSSAILSEFTDFDGALPGGLDADDITDRLTALIAKLRGTDGLCRPPAAPIADVTLHFVENETGASILSAHDAANFLGSAQPERTVLITTLPETSAPMTLSPAVNHSVDLREAGRDPLSFPQLPALSGLHQIMLAPRDAARLPSGDPDGTAGQVQRLKQAMALLAAEPGTVVMADAGAGHAAWMALNEMGAGIDHLIVIGTPLTAAQKPINLDIDEEDMLSRLSELMPPFTDMEPDDEVLALARSFLKPLTGLSAKNPTDVNLPAAWTLTKRPSLSVHAVYGVATESAIEQAITAIIAAGLSLRSQVQAVKRAAQEITGAGMGLYMPLVPNVTAEALALKGHVLAELIGTDIDSTSPLPEPQLRDARRVLGQLELSRNERWLIGGPGEWPRPDLELRALEFHGQFSYDGSTIQPDRLRLVLYGVRIHDQTYPRLEIDASIADGDLGIEGLAAPTTPEIAQMLTQLMGEIETSADAGLSQLASLLRGAGILGSGSSFDPLSLSHWIDDPASRMADALANSSLRSHILQSIEAFFVGQSTLTYNPLTQELSVDLNGSTSENLFKEWGLLATLSPSGLSQGSLRIGEENGLNLSVQLAPDFEVTLNFAANTASPFAGSLPSELLLWPVGDMTAVWPTLPPIAITHVLSRAIEGLRHADADAKPFIDALLEALGMIESGNPDARVMLPPIALIDPVAWIGSVLGQSTTEGQILNSGNVIDFLDTLKPFIGISGASGVWDIAPGLALRVQNTPDVLIEFVIDAAQFQTSSQLDFGGSFGLEFASGLSPRPRIAAYAGLQGGLPETRAVHLTLSGPELHLFLRPDTGQDISLYPNLSGFSALGLAALRNALPLALDAVVDHGAASTDNLAKNAGLLVADLGDALDLRNSANPKAFDSGRLSDFASAPAGWLVMRWSNIIGVLSGRIEDVLPQGLTLETVQPNGDLVLTLNDVVEAGSWISVTLTNSASPHIIFETIQTDLPLVGKASAKIIVTSEGLETFTMDVGPADILISSAVHLRPLFEFDINSITSPDTVSLGMALDASGDNKLNLVYNLNDESFALAFNNNTDSADTPAAIMYLAINLLSGFILALPEVDEFLELTIGTDVSTQKTFKSILSGVVLTANGDALDSRFFQVIPFGTETLSAIRNDKKARILELVDNIAGTNPSVVIDDVIRIGIGRVDNTTGNVVQNGGTLGLTVGFDDPTKRYALIDGNISIWIENDNRWIIDSLGPGFFFGIFDTSQEEFDPIFRIDGLGLRIGRKNAPLLKSPIGLGSIAVHVLTDIGGPETLGGVQVQLSDISVAVGGASGGNKVAQGLLAETNDGEATLAPAFSPAISVQTRPSGAPAAFKFKGGDGEGPWWVPVQRQFGPLYVGQIGLGSQEVNNELQSVSLLFDGNVSLAGLTASVDDLELRYNVAGDIFNSSSWDVDLAGLAVSADISGVSLAGGLRKFTDNTGIEYIGMLNARFSTYGLSIYGGYARHEAYTAFFAYGAVLGPFGGPPAFFLTGIGGGFGINREIIPPTDMRKFNEFPMLAALDSAAAPPDDLMTNLANIRSTFPAAQGRYWFAAGISFTSFALVDGIAVIAVEFGAGFELSIFGLARMALPTPDTALLSIELGLIARFSTEEGVLWIQAQLTDNSWLFHRSARLTGGFAFVSWFKGPNRGQFVLTLGGYHPNFNVAGYPKVPRLGFNWTPNSKVTIKAESYFALTSEAMMAGGAFEASAKYGSAYANLKFGGNAIIYYDPFKYMADAYASVSAGIRIKTWLGTVNLSFSLGAWIEVSGPRFNGTAGIEVGPIDITVQFGDNDVAPETITWVRFAEKYLELAPGNRARALSSIAGRGALPPASATGEEPGTADGSAERPFDVSSEFELSLTTTIPLNEIQLGTNAPISESVTATLGLAPMQKPLDISRLSLSLKNQKDLAVELIKTPQIIVSSRRSGSFPKGVWGEAQDNGNRKIPKGEVITATEGVDFVFQAIGHKKIPEASTGGIAFDQVEAGLPKPLPLRPVGTLNSRLISEAQAQREALGGVDDEKMPALARRWAHALNRRSTPHRASFREQATPMRITLLGERIIAHADHGIKEIVTPFDSVTDFLVYETPRLRGLLTTPVGGGADQFDEVTTLTLSQEKLAKIQRVAPPVLTDSLVTRHKAVSAPLLRVEIAKVQAGDTIIARHAAPPTSTVRAAVSNGSKGAGKADRSILKGVSDMMLRAPTKSGVTSKAPRALTPGEVAIFDMPGSAKAARFDNAGTLKLEGKARLVVFDAYGNVLVNQAPAKPIYTLPCRAAHIAILAGDIRPTGPQDVRGWSAASQLAYFGRSLARCAGGFVMAPGATRARGERQDDIGWFMASILTDQAALIETRFDGAARSVAIIIEGRVTEDALASIALGFEGATAVEETPLLVPFDDKTLVVYELTKSEKPFSVHVGGLTYGRLDGVLASDLVPDNLVTRIVNETAQPSINFSTGKSVAPVEFHWTKPADVPAEKVE